MAARAVEAINRTGEIVAIHAPPSNDMGACSGGFVDFARREWSGQVTAYFEDEEALRRILYGDPTQPPGGGLLPPDFTEADLILDHIRADTIALPLRTFEMFRDFGKPRAPKPPVALPITRQQRRYQARKGRK